MKLREPGAYIENLPVISTFSIIYGKLPIRDICPVNYRQVNNKYTCSYQPANFKTEQIFKIAEQIYIYIYSDKFHVK